MSESQFEKMCKALSKAERERDLSRHTLELQDGTINELRDEINRLRGLLSKSREYVDNVVLADELDEELYKEVGDAHDRRSY